MVTGTEKEMAGYWLQPQYKTTDWLLVTGTGYDRWQVTGYWHGIRQVAGLLAQYKTGCRFAGYRHSIRQLTGYWHRIRQVAGLLAQDKTGGRVTGAG